MRDWSARTKVREGDRLVWYGEDADDHYWERYWGELERSVIDRAACRELSQSTMGRMIQAHIAPCRAIEAGCGVGEWVATLGAAGFDIVGVEKSPEVVEAVHRVAPDLPVQQGDVTALAFDDNSFDAYLSFGVIEHFRDGPDDVLREAWRLLRPGALAIFSVPNFGPVRRLRARLGRYAKEPGQLGFYQYGFRPRDLATLLRSSGFEVLRVDEQEPHRLLLEESRAYRWLNQQHLQRFTKKAATRLLEGRDGHVVAALVRNP